MRIKSWHLSASTNYVVVVGVLVVVLLVLRVITPDHSKELTTSQLTQSPRPNIDKHTEEGLGTLMVSTAATHDLQFSLYKATMVCFLNKPLGN